MRGLLLSILILFLLSGCASERLTVWGSSAKYTIPFEWPTFQKQKLAKYRGIVHEGMSRQTLYRAFDKALVKNHRKEGSEEWITFINWTTEEPADLVTFYLIDGKVRSWREK